MADKSILKDIGRAAAYIKSKSKGVRPQVLIVLGSGLNEALPPLKKQTVIAYDKIPGFPEPTVKGHTGRLILGEGPQGGVAILQGRYHFYEGHSMARITMPLRALHRLGLQTAILTSAVGSLRRDLKPGDLCVLNDHMNFMGANPLQACHTAEYGEMFPDLAGAYSKRLRILALAECRKAGITAKEGVYTAASGPSYETPAEIRAFAKLGGSVVGMSVVPEVIVARQLGIEVVGLSWIANMAAGMSKDALTHHDVLELGKKMAARLGKALTGLLGKI
ncbi:MAG: purine-nucleoside phosphorylase [Elusimicrobia bacterium CG1_02_63_36]|nr:MAG: purine-nucleoside phosphorylase [Elusimicrobia bacterium CG1_02_63_36]